ncbi:MAG: peptidoglycan DD-metalloendopeptidase family protein, partial [Anaerolineae bacterium]|nr:peptidoglycan DD-metalloendopeptidase family protein [Anaerolineae bacterium]
NWSPPPLIPPISRDPLGRDHYWFQRPIASDGNSSLLFVYTFGSDGPEDQWRVHHGIDLPNPIGDEVYAAGDGVVVFASDGRSGQTDIFQNTSSYGNVVFIEHDFSYDGQPVYTLYAHLQAALVRAGDVVKAGDPIALVGNTGVVSGPHVHFEVRIGSDRYGATYNPVLWMVPYVGHGVIAGRVVDTEGEFVDDVLVTIRSFDTGLLHPATVTTYNFPGTVDDVNPDPNWQENFAITDIPAGRWDVIVSLNGQRIVQQVEVFEGTTSFVELRLPERPTEDAPPDETTEEQTDGEASS